MRAGSRRYLSKFQSADSKLDEYYKYFATQASLRPWIYRPKNANTLLAMDLKDSESDAPLKPRAPVRPLSKQVLNTYIWSAQEASQLLSLLRKWTSLTTRKRGVWDYFTAEHIQNILFASTFKLGKLSSFLQHLYMWKPLFAEAGNDRVFDVEHFFNSLVTCQLHRNAVRELGDANVAEKKLLNAWHQVSVKENKTGLTSYLVSALAKQQGFPEVKLPGLADADVLLPHIDLGATKSGKIAAFASKHRFLYLMARTIDEYGTPSEPISSFIQNYQAAQKSLGQNDVYQEYVVIARRLNSEPHAPTVTAPHPADDQ